MVGYRTRAASHILFTMSSTIRVFVVDADSSARNGLARLLRAAGHEVRACSSSDEFLSSIDPGSRSCAVLDAGILEPGGVELSAALAGANLAVIVVTADDAPETRRMARTMQAAGVFRKPVDGTALIDAVTWALRSNTRDSDHGHNER